jgi:hypothetical protein
MAWPKPVDALWRDLESVWPAHGKPFAEQLATLKAVRENRTHLGQVGDVKRATGFPAA